MFEIFFINHASFVIKTKDSSLVSDPWVDGMAFNKSWSLLSNTPENAYCELKNTKNVYITHEHPDHFSVKNLKEFCSNKNFIFQKTKDKRVYSFLKKITQNVKEVIPDERYKISENFFISIYPFQDIDSYAFIEVNGKKILNLNDCHFKKEKEIYYIKKKFGDIDLLSAQFSYAIGNTNRNENETRRIDALQKINDLNKLIKILSPTYFLPFASFSYFSSQENFYLNDHMNKIDKTILSVVKENSETKVLCMYPGDKWKYGDLHENDLSVSKYLIDYKKKKVTEEKRINFDKEELNSIIKTFIDNCKKNNSLFIFYYFLKKNLFSLNFNLTDLDITIKFDSNIGIKDICKNEKSNTKYCDLSYDSLLNLFSTGYGYDTLMIGGKFECDKLGSKALSTIFKFQIKNYRNQYYNILDSIFRIFRKLKRNYRVSGLR